MREEANRFWVDCAAGLLIGVLLALAECCIHWARGSSLLSPPLLPGMLVLYALYWGAFGLGVAILLRIFRALFPGNAGSPWTGAAILTGAAVALTAHAAAVSHLFVDVPRPWSTILLAAALVLIAPIAHTVHVLLRRRRAPRPGRMAAAAAAILLLSFPLKLLPEKGAETGSGGAGVRKEAPHIFLIVFDTLRFDHTGAYGYARSTSPNLDGLAEGGVLFQNAYAPSSWTLPSTASILTSRYPSSHGVITRSSALPEGIETISALLRDHGYRTGLFSGNPFVEPHFGFGNGFSYIFAPQKPLYMKLFYLPYYLKRTVGRAPGLHETNEFVTWYETLWRPVLQKEWLRGDALAGDLFRWIDRSGEGPFFAHIQIMEPHDPYEGIGKFGPEGISQAPHVGIAPLYPYDTLPHPSEENLDIMVGRYDDDVWTSDRIVGDIVRGLEERRIRDDSWIVLTSDHGEEFWDHDGWGHGNSLFEELIRVPLVFNGKGIEARRVPSMARLIDIAPTLADLAGVESPPAFIGRSLLPVLLGAGEETGVERTFAELRRATGRESWALLLADGRKLIRARKGYDEALFLFDLARDRMEKKNLAGEDSLTAKELLRELEVAAERAAEGKSAAQAPELDAVTKRRLRALGYAD